MVVSACQALGSPIQNEVFSGDLSPCAMMILSLIQSPYLDRVGGEGAAVVPGRQALSASSSFSRSAVSSRFPQHSSPGKLLFCGCLRQWSTVCPSPHRRLLPDWESLVGLSHSFLFCSNSDSQFCLHLEDDRGYFYLYFKSVIGMC